MGRGIDQPGDVQTDDNSQEHAPQKPGHTTHGEQDKAKEKTPPSPAESFVILTVLRGKQLGPMHTGFKLQEGDVAAVAIWADERERAVEVLRELGWAPHVEEEDSSAENV